MINNNAIKAVTVVFTMLILAACGKAEKAADDVAAIKASMDRQEAKQAADEAGDKADMAALAERRRQAQDRETAARQPASAPASDAQ